MKIKYKSLAVALCAAGCMSSLAFASTTHHRYHRTSDQAKLARMQRQLNQLQSEMGDLKGKVKRAKLKTVSKDVKQLKEENIFHRLGDSVVIAPFTEQPTFYSGGQLVVNAPSINTDAKLLYRRYLDQQKFLKANLPLPANPRLVLSGSVTGQAIVSNPYAGAHSTDINLSGAELDAFAELTDWVNGFISMTYDDSLADTSNRRVSNSNIHLDKGFITIGNFRASSFYGSIGQMYVPFGRYASNMISSPLTKYIGKTKGRAISLSYAAAPWEMKYAPYATVFLAKGDSKYGNSNLAKQFGVDTGVRFGSDAINSSVGVSYISNIADSDGMQDNGQSSNFRGFDKTSSGLVSDPERLVHRVGGASIHATIALKKFTLLAEYVTALQEFSASNMTFNSHGAKPRAFNAELAYTFALWKLPTTAAVGYGMSRQALALNIPTRRYIASIQTTILKNTIASLEYRHDINYNRSDAATGQGIDATTSSDLGRADNAVTAQLAVYF